MDPYYADQAAAGPSSSATAAASDPYAQFYYWDAPSNNWAFDYSAYYAAYGYPTDGSANGGWNAAYAAGGSGSSQAQQATAPAGPSPWDNIPEPGSAASFAAPKEKKKPFVPGPKDADGKAIAGQLKKGETRTTVLRKGVGSQVYEDLSLLEWDPTHKRLFVGDLGNDVTDGMLTKAFEKYPTFSKARVVRTKGEESKSKGYGFVAFGDPKDFLKAWKEMDGKYIGSRPCRLKKANDEVAPVSIGARKDKLLASQYQYDAFKAKYKMGGAIGGDLRKHGIGKAWKQK